MKTAPTNIIFSLFLVSAFSFASTEHKRTLFELETQVPAKSTVYFPNSEEFKYEGVLMFKRPRIYTWLFAAGITAVTTGLLSGLLDPMNEIPFTPEQVFWRELGVVALSMGMGEIADISQAEGLGHHLRYQTKDETGADSMISMRPPDQMRNRHNDVQEKLKSLLVAPAVRLTQTRRNEDFRVKTVIFDADYEDHGDHKELVLREAKVEIEPMGHRTGPETHIKTLSKVRPKTRFECFKSFLNFWK